MWSVNENMNRRMSARTSAAGTLTLAALLLLGACTASPPPPSAATSTPAQPVPSGTAEAGSPSPSPGLPVRPVGDPVVIASGLNAPWSILHFPNEGTLISERDTTLVRELLPDGALRDAGRVAEARPGGEGGLLGLAALPDPAAPGGTGWVYAYLTGADDNRIVRMPLFGSAGSHTLGDAEPVLDPQGIAWDSTGQLWASEFGQNTWDELNRITAGGNYGWPVVEGMQGTDADPGFIDPVQQWPTSEASPSGLAIVNDTIFMAALRGERLWRFHPSTGEVDDWFVNSFGRLRDVVPGPDGTLWFVSNNTDGRGTPSPGDDRLYQVAVAP